MLGTEGGTALGMASRYGLRDWARRETSRWWLVCFYLYEGPYAQRGDASILPYAVMDQQYIEGGRVPACP